MVVCAEATPDGVLVALAAGSVVVVVVVPGELMVDWLDEFSEPELDVVLLLELLDGLALVAASRSAVEPGADEPG